MRALVTGDAGFIGRNFRARLMAADWDVVGIDLKHGEDVRLMMTPGGELDGQRFDLLVHAAAVIGGRLGIDGDPLGVAQNLTLDQVALSWAVRTHTPVLYFSSSAAYPVHLQRARGAPWLPEYAIERGDLIGRPDQTYGWAKLVAEQALIPQARAQHALITVVRPFSGYGTDQSEDYPFPAFIARALRHEDPFPIWGDGTQTRDWIHVDDIVAACLTMVTHMEPGPVNLCTGIGTSFTRLAELVTREAGYAPDFVYMSDRPTGVLTRVGNPERLHRIYWPKVPLIEGIRRALAGAP